MIKKLILIFLTLSLTLSAFAGTTTVSGTVTGSDAQLWTNGSYIITFRPTPGKPLSQFTVNGLAFDQGPFTGPLDGFGNFSIILTDNNTIQPAGSQWIFTVCPNASAPCNIANITITGATQNVSTDVSANASILVNSPPISKAYTDNEVHAPTGVASLYYNTVSNSFRVWTGTQWIDIGSSSSIINNFVPFDCSFDDTIPNGYLQQLDALGNAFCNFGAIWFQSNGTQVGIAEQSLNLIDSANLTWTIVDDPLNNRMNVTPTLVGVGSGTVTSFSAGNLAPLFTTGVATNTTTPALSFTQSTAANGTVFGNFTGGVAVPSFTAFSLTGAITTTSALATTLNSRFRYRDCEILIGDPGSASPALANDNDSPSVCGNDYGADYTITAVSCYADAGTPTVTPILTGGSGTSILTGALTCGTAAWAAGTINGTPTVHTFSANGTTCSSTPCTIDANITTAGGTAKYINIKVTRLIASP